MTDHLTIAKGATTTTLPMKTPTDLKKVIGSPLLECQVLVVTTASEYQHLMKALPHTTRPFAVAVWTVK
jgi:hypothetical protein